MKIKSAKNRSEKAGILIAMFIVGLIVVVVGGVFVSGLLEVVKKKRVVSEDSEEPPTQVYTFVVWATNCPCITNNYPWLTVTNCPCADTNYPPVYPPPSYGSLAEEENHIFKLQYGLDEIGIPWVVAGTNLPLDESPAQPLLVVVPLRSSSTNLEQLFYFENGQVWSNALNLVSLVETNDDIVTTNTSLIVTTEFFDTWTPPSPTGEDVIIEVSITLAGPWRPIFTNRIVAGSVWGFTDTRGDPVSGFYRTMKR